MYAVVTCSCARGVLTGRASRDLLTSDSSAASQQTGFSSRPPSAVVNGDSGADQRRVWQLELPVRSGRDCVSGVASAAVECVVASVSCRPVRAKARLKCTYRSV